MAEEAKPEQKTEVGPTAAEAKAASEIFHLVQIDTYDDIFSDFDTSPYEKRILSDDFLNELHKHYLEMPKGEFAVMFAIPGPLRSEKTEALVKKRIKNHFRERIKVLEHEYRKNLVDSLVRLACGVLLTSPLVLFPQLDVQPILTIISVLVWYSFWSGFEGLIAISRRIKRKKSFNERFYRAEYNFNDEKDVACGLGRR